MFPFGDTLCVCDVPGQAILDELELGVRLAPEKSGGLLHVAGMSYTVDTTVPTPIQLDERNNLKAIAPGPRRVKDVMIGGEPLDPGRTYLVVSSNYVLREGGDGHRFEGKRLTKPDFITLVDALAHYLRSFPAIPEEYRAPQGRMKVIQ